MEGTVAYFSAEFGINEALPVYSGGLGVLAGDTVKTAADLAIPFVGVGILYRRGYFEQRLRPDGTQEALYPELNLPLLPITPVVDNKGNALLIEVPIARDSVFLRVWRVDIGKSAVYLLDSDNPANSEENRRLTDSLYGGDARTRISQEIILGIGGARLLAVLGIEPAVWHLNEGHVAFLSLERICRLVAAGIEFATAVEAVKASTVFTTHTPVAAGHDVFSLDLVERFLGSYLDQAGIQHRQALALGRVGEGFNMTRLALSTSCKVNGVSKIHAQVTKELFHRWTPEIPGGDISVEGVTNGVHLATWLAPELKALYNKYLGPDWQARQAEGKVWESVQQIPDRQLWECRQIVKKRMLVNLQIPSSTDVFTIGFARRFATYKRALLVFRDLARLAGIINRPQFPVVFIFAGKAHPADLPGQDLIRRIIEISRLEQFKGRVFFVENYNLALAKQLVQGVDLWLNTPLKPLEASGTSGMKAAVNGVLNCSVMDGWWAEGYNGQNGWAIAGSVEDTRENNDKNDAAELYRLLEDEIVPLYYRRSGGLPLGWIARMKEGIRSLAPVFSSNRMMLEYRDKFYQPIVARARRFKADGFAVAAKVAAYKEFIRGNWRHVQVQSFGLDTDLVIRAKVKLGPIWHNDVQVEAVGSDGVGGIWRRKLQLAAELGDGTYRYEQAFGQDMACWRRSNANVRVIPISPDFTSDFELELTRWGQQQWR